MAQASSKKQTDTLPPPNLVESRESASRKIKIQLEKGIELRNRPINSTRELEQARSDRDKWTAFNRELLTRLFDNRSVADEYCHTLGGFLSLGSSTFGQDVDEFRYGVRDKITRLEAILDRLELIPESIPATQPSSPTKDKHEACGQNVFIVHGHDESAKQTLARFVEKLGCQAVILHEQASASRTIIEKVEGYSNVGFVVVLLTPDDVGASREAQDALRPRARQNVVFELGYFFGRLGREKVCALYKADMELPSDLSGVVYVPMDDNGAWKLLVAREMRQAGLNIDLNQML